MADTDNVSTMDTMGTMEDLSVGEALTAEEKAYLDGRGEVQEAGEAASGEAGQGKGQEGGDGAQDEGGHVKMVPHQALHAEREEKRREREEKNRLAAEKARLEARLDMILSQMGQGQGQEGQAKGEEAPPDPAEDMVGFMRWQAQTLARQQAEQREAQARLEQERAVQEQEAALHALVDRSRQEVLEELPDVGAAIDFLRDVRDRQLAFLSSVEPQLADPQARAQMIEQEARQLIVAAAQNGQNPVRLLYDLAKNNGYSGQNGQGQNGQGQGQGAGADVVTRVEAIASAQGAAKTLASSAGSAATTPTAEMIANMDEEEFDAWYEKNARLFNKIMGA